MTARPTPLRRPALLRPPAEVAPIATIIGADATLLLVEQHGGIRIKVPSKARPSSALARTIGHDALRLLVQAYGGNTLNIPLCKHWRVKVLRVRDGQSYAEIARNLGMVESTVYRYLAAADLLDQPRLPGL